MPLLRPLDPAFPLDRQLAVDATPVVLVNLVTLDKADEPRFLEAWQNDAAFMKRQPGFISTQLHRAIGGLRPIQTSSIALSSTVNALAPGRADAVGTWHSRPRGAN
jgi:hypothetical protein